MAKRALEVAELLGGRAYAVVYHYDTDRGQGQGMQVWGIYDTRGEAEQACKQQYGALVAAMQASRRLWS